MPSVLYCSNGTELLSVVLGDLFVLDVLGRLGEPLHLQPLRGLQEGWQLILKLILILISIYSL